MVRQPKALPASYPAPALETTPTVAFRRARIRPAFGIVAVWKDTLTSFCAHSATILLCACAGVAAPIVVAKVVDTIAKLTAQAQTGSVQAIYDQPAWSTMLAGAVAGVFGLTLARGVITWVALHGSRHGSLRGEAIRTTITHFPALLAGALLYGLLVTSGIIGLSELSQRLEYRRDRALHMWMGLSPALGDGLHQVAWRGFNGLIPNPGPPSADFMPSLRHAVEFATAAAHAKTVRIEDMVSAYGSGHTVEHTAQSASRLVAYPGWISPAVFPAFALGSVFVLLFVETLLRFRTVMALNPPGTGISRRVSLLAPLLASARFGLRHFGRITIHIWVVRLAAVALILVLVELPLAIMDHLVMPNALRFPIPLAIVPILDFLTTSSAALVSAMLIAFGVVYDARLYKNLSESRL